MMADGNGTITITAEQVVVRYPDRHHFLRAQEGEAVSFRWSEVTRVVAFKRDCVTVDSIRMLFELNGSTAVEVWEEMSGWATLVQVLPVHMAGALRFEEWFQKVAFPAFAPCLTQLYPAVPAA